VELFKSCRGNLVRTLDVRATAIAFSPDGQRLVVVDPGHNVQLVALS
jgi:hypothetical protein